MIRPSIVVLCTSLIGANASAFGACVDVAGEFCKIEHYDDSDIGKAMTICQQHEQNFMMVVPPQHQYGERWKACYQVRAQWEKTEDARRQQEAAEQEKRDKAFVEKIAGESK